MWTEIVIGLISLLRDRPNVGIGVVLLALLVLLAMVVWVSRPGHEDRWLVLVAAGLCTLVVGCFYTLAVSLKWWQGRYFEVPILVQVAILLPVSLVIWALWIGGYRWLSSRTQYVLGVYLQLSLLIVALIVIADNLELGRGQILLAANQMVWQEAAIGIVVTWLPILLYESTSRVLERLNDLP